VIAEADFLLLKLIYDIAIHKFVLTL